MAQHKAKYRSLGGRYVKTVRFGTQKILKIDPKALELLAAQAMRDVSFLMRPAHQKQVAAILKDPEASPNDKAVAWELLENSVIASRFELPLCQDTGTAIVIAKKGQAVWTGADDAAALSSGIRRVYKSENLRYSQVVALDMYEEVNSGDNMPAQIDIYATVGDKYEFLFLAKGGGSANKTYLFQETKAVLNPAALKGFLTDKMRSLGTAACPPYHIAITIGGTSAETCLKTVKLASAGALDHLPGKGDKQGRPFRDFTLENELLKAAQAIGLGAQFGGKYFAHDVKVVRLPRHGASCPIGLGVSCSADRNIKAYIDAKGVWLEALERDPARLLKNVTGIDSKAVAIDLNRSVKDICAQLSSCPVATRLSLTGRLIVARDIAHAKIKEMLDAGHPLPDYFKKHPVYYAGPAKTPAGKASGSFGPTTSGRMDSYVDCFQSNGASLIMVGKGNRTAQVTEACRKHGGFYLGSTGGAAALLAERCIKKVEVVDFPNLGMEAVWAIDVVDFPAYILIDDKGNDFFKRFL